MIFLKSPVSRIVPTNVKGGFWIFEHPFYCKKEEKLKGDPLETLQKNTEKESQSRNNMHKKIGKGRESNRCRSACQTSKNLN